MISYRPFIKNDINEIDIVFKKSMLSVLNNIFGIYLFILDYYKYLIFILYFILPINFILYIIILLPSIFYIGTCIFLYIFVYYNKPSSKLELYSRADNTILLILDNKKIIGFSSFIKYNQPIYLGFMEYFFIDIDYQLKGYSKKLLQYNYHYIKMRYRDDYNAGKYIIGGTSGLQLSFWKKYADKIEEQEYIFYGFKIDKFWMKISAIKNYRIYFKKNNNSLGDSNPQSFV